MLRKLHCLQRMMLVVLFAMFGLVNSFAIYMADTRAVAKMAVKGTTVLSTEAGVIWVSTELVDSESDIHAVSESITTDYVRISDEDKNACKVTYYFYVKPNPGYVFIGWATSQPSKADWKPSSAAYEVDENKKVGAFYYTSATTSAPSLQNYASKTSATRYAVFEEDPNYEPPTTPGQTYKVTVSKPATGCATMTATPNVDVEEGAEVTLMQTPAEGYAFDGWVINGTATGVKTSPYQYIMPARNVTVSGLYKQAEYTISTDVSLGGTVTTNKTSSVKGNYIAITYTPDDGYRLKDAYVENNTTGLVVPFLTGYNTMFQMPASDVTVHAVFELIPSYDISAPIEATYGKGTFYSDYAMIIPANTNAYTGEIVGESLQLTQVTGEVIPAQTAVVITGEGGLFRKSNTPASLPVGVKNDLRGVSVDTNAEDVLSNLMDKVYVLGVGNVSGTIGFFEFTGATLSANKAYLVLSPINASAGIRMEFPGEATAIKSVEAKSNNRMMYNLNGQRVNASAKGIVIMNGKKVVK